FQSPALEVGSTYAYSLQATWRGQTVKRQVLLRPGQLTTIDLREELQAAVAPPAPASISLQAPEALALAAGQSAKLRVRVRRANYKGPVTLRLEGLPEGVTAGKATLAPGSDEAAMELTASSGASEAEREALLAATGEQVATRATI